MIFVQSSAKIVGLISDTHGLLRPDVFDVFKDVELIVHAGDVGGDDILDELQTIAPVYAVRGNTDPIDNPRLPESRRLHLGDAWLHVSHGHEVGARPETLLATYDADVIVYGHTHRELITYEGSRLAVNPGAAGARRFNLMPCVGILTIGSGDPTVKLVRLRA